MLVLVDKMAQQVKGLPHNHEDWSLNPQSPGKKLAEYKTK